MGNRRDHHGQYMKGLVYRDKQPLRLTPHFQLHMFELWESVGVRLTNTTKRQRAECVVHHHVIDRHSSTRGLTDHLF